MASDYADIGIGTSENEASKLLTEILRKYRKDNVEDIEHLGNEGAVKNIDYRSIDVIVRGRLLQSRVEALTGKKVVAPLLTDMYYIALSQYLNLKKQEEFSGSDAHYEIIANFTDNSDIVAATRISRMNPVVSRGIAIEFATSLIEELERMAGEEGQSGTDAKNVLKAILKGGGKGDGNERSKSPQKNGEGGEGENDKCNEDGEGQAERSKDSRAEGKVPLGAIIKAGERAKQQAETMEALLAMAGRGTTSSKNANQEEVEELARNSKVRDVLELAKSMPKIDVNRTIKYREERPGEKFDLVHGDDIIDTHISDFMAPAEQFYMNWMESRLKNHLRGNPENSGPIYVLVDKSGSMAGEKVVWAKTVTLKLFQSSRSEGRDFSMRFFDEMPHELIKASAGDGKSKINTVREICTMESGGGTKIDAIIDKALSDIEAGKWNGEKGKPTLIIITDGEDNLSYNSIKDRLERNRVELVSVMVKGRNSDLKRLSPNYFEVQKMDGDAALKLVNVGISASKKKRTAVY